MSPVYVMASKVAPRYGLRIEQLLSSSRETSVSAAKHELWFRLWDEWRWSFLQIATELDLDHTSVAYGVRKHAAACGVTVVKVGPGRRVRAA